VKDTKRKEGEDNRDTEAEGIRHRGVQGRKKRVTVVDGRRRKIGWKERYRGGLKKTQNRMERELQW